MKRNKLLMLTGLIAMTLVGCGDKTSSSVTPTSSNDPSSSIVDSSKTSDSSISSVPGDSSLSSKFESSSKSDPSSIPVSSSTSKSSSSSSSKDSSSSSKSSSSVSSSVTPTDWTTAEKGVIQEYCYSMPLPFMYVEGASALDYDEDYGGALKLGGTSSATLLDNYAAKFDTEVWESYQYDATEDGAYGYVFSAAVETEEGVRYLNVQMFGVEYDAEYGDLMPTEDGSGNFFFLAYDPYYYEWPKEIVDLYTEYIFESEDITPAFNGADLYDFDTTYLSLYGVFALYCYTEDTASIVTYGAILENAGFKYLGMDDYDYECYASPSGNYEVDLYYDEDYEDLDIWWYPYEVIVPTAIEMPTALSVSQGKSKTIEAYLVDEEGEEVDGYTIDFDVISTSAGITFDSSTATVTVANDAVVGSTAVIEASCYEDGLELTAECTVTVKAPSANYNKVTTKSDIVNGGKYLIVCDDKKVAFNSSLETIDAENNFVSYTKDGDAIVADDDLEALAVTITFEGSNYYIQCANGDYVASTANANKLSQSETESTLSLNITSGNLDVSGATGAHFRYNDAGNRFRFYKASSYSNQTDVQLYAIA